jgi:glutathione S-transferase
MKLYLFPPSSRVLGIVALKNYLGLDCELQPIDLGRGDQLARQYIALNPNKKMPTLEESGFVLWESNAILFYMAVKRPGPGTLANRCEGAGGCSALASLGERALGRRVLRHGRLREGVESSTRPRPTGPRLHRARRAKL